MMATNSPSRLVVLETKRIKMLTFRLSFRYDGPCHGRMRSVNHACHLVSYSSLRLMRNSSVLVRLVAGEMGRKDNCGLDQLSWQSY